MEKIKYLVMDVDGTLTDGKIYMGENGEIMKVFSIKDGYAISYILPEHGIVPIVITGRKSKIVENRCKELGITELHQGCLEKKEKLIEILQRYGEDISGEKLYYCACIGDDVLDIPLMMICDVSGCPCDAVGEVKARAAYISKYRGGDGVVRDFVDRILNM
jgi:3-deoxy-D-manno-octulosonate 8-phosphate phosphatase, YrbI family